MAGRIPDESRKRVKLILNNKWPLAVSVDYIRLEASIARRSVKKICEEIGAELVETTNGVYYRWRPENA